MSTREQRKETQLLNKIMLNIGIQGILMFLSCCMEHHAQETMALVAHAVKTPPLTNSNKFI